MIFNLRYKSEYNQALEYFQLLEQQKAIVEIKKKSATRSIGQNKYVHVLLSICALNYGDTLDYFKQIILKQIICPEIFKTEFTNFITGEKREAWKSSADLTTEEMTLAIERLKIFASQKLGIDLPDASNTEHLYRLQNELEKHKKWL